MIRRWLREYYETQDLALVREQTSLRQMVPSAVFVFAVVPALAQWPAFQAYFAFQWRIAIWLVVPEFIKAFVAHVYLQKHGTSFGWWALHLLCSPLFVACLGGWVLLVSAEAAPAMASLLVLTLLVHGYVYQYTPRYILGPILDLAVIAAIIPFSPSPRHTAVLAFATIAGLIAAMMVGNSALRRNNIQRENAALKEAMQAEALLRTHNDMHEISQVTVGLLGQLHDARNALMAAKLQADLLRDELKNGEAMDRALCEEVSIDLVAAIAQLEHNLGDVRDVARARGAQLSAKPLPEAITVSIHPLLRELSQRIGKRYSDRSIAFTSSCDHVKVMAVGGDITLRRVFENLLINACQGDGKRAARQVHVMVTDSVDTEWVEVTVSDDGPGFPAEWVRERTRAIHTTKIDGSGLGLLTSDRLVSACGGTLQIANRDDGGARVVVRLLKEVRA